MPNSHIENGFVRILFVADLVGGSGRFVVSNLLPKLKKEKEIDFVIGNGENTAGGMGLTPELAKKVYHYGINVITTGNHIWDKISKLEKYLNEKDTLLRPINYPEGNPGKGSVVVDFQGIKIGVINAQGRTFMFPIDCPFRRVEKEIEKIKEQTNIIFIDFHAEATSEKIAFAKYFDGKVSAVIGTHTHVQTNDLSILKGGTAYLTDAGMCGAIDSVIGMRYEESIHRFVYQTPKRFVPENGDVMFNGVIVDIDVNTGKSIGAELVNEELLADSGEDYDSDS